MGLEFLHRLGRIVDEREAGTLATAELRPEAEDGDLVLAGLVEFGELGAEFVFGDVGAVGVEDIAVGFVRNLHILGCFAWFIQVQLTRPFVSCLGERCG